MNLQATNRIFLSPDEVASAIDSNDAPLIIDLGDDNRYLQQHLPGAVHLPFSTLVNSQPPVAGLMPDPSEVSTALASIGFRSGQRVIAYDDAGGGKAGRLIFTLHALREHNAQIIDGGWNAWLASGGSTDSQTVVPQASDFSADYSNADNLVDKPWILQQLENDEVALLDTRTAGEFSGADIRAARGGHIPGAAHYDWMQAMDIRRQHALRPESELLAELAERGITPDKQVVVYCQTHHRSAHTYAMLKQLGFNKVAGYPGAWSDWGNDSQVPVVN